MQEEFSVLGIEADDIGRKYIGGEVRRESQNLLAGLARRRGSCDWLSSGQHADPVACHFRSPEHGEPFSRGTCAPSPTEIVRWSGTHLLVTGKLATPAGRRHSQNKNWPGRSRARPLKSWLVDTQISKRRCLAPAAPAPGCTATCTSDAYAYAWHAHPYPTNAAATTTAATADAASAGSAARAAATAAASVEATASPGCTSAAATASAASALGQLHAAAEFFFVSKSWNVARLTSESSSSPSVIIMPGTKLFPC